MSRIIAVFLLVFSSFAAQGFPDKNDSLRFEILLTSKMLNDINFSGKFLNTLDITSNRLILLSTSDQFYLVGWGGIVPLGERLAGKISTYAFTPDSLLMMVKENEICRINSAGNLITLFKLPNPAMGISAGESVMYVYDRTKNQQKNALFVLTQGGKYGKILEVNTPINSVLEVNNSIIFSAENAVFRLDTKSRQLKELVALPGDQMITSVTANHNTGRIYFSTEKAIYAFRDSDLVTITEKFGGVLRYFNDGLIVFNPDKNLLIRMTGIDDRIAAEMETAGKPTENKLIKTLLTNSTIISLVNAKTSDEQIINLINNSPVNFNTSVDSMIYLSGRNVSSDVILAMRNAMKTTGKRFFIITGSYPTEEKAREAVADLRLKGFGNAQVVGKSNAGTFRIASKGYNTIEEATKDLADVKQKLNPSAWIFESK